MRIELENLEGGKGDFAHVYNPDELNPVDERVKLTAPATVNGKIRLAGNEVFVNGHVDTRAQVECDRCLKLIELPVNADFEMSVAVFDGEALDVDEIVKEQILLAVPTRMLCREDCKGICPQCGVDKNTGECNCETKEIDPRWAALKNLN
jgi:uncharacterized protein